MSEQMEPARLDELMVLASGGGWLRSGEANELLAHVDAAVTLITDSPYLRNYHGAQPGAIGVVVGYSALAADDTGVMVDWGRDEGGGRCVRMDLDELQREKEQLLADAGLLDRFNEAREQPDRATEAELNREHQRGKFPHWLGRLFRSK